MIRLISRFRFCKEPEKIVLRHERQMEEIYSKILSDKSKEYHSREIYTNTTDYKTVYEKMNFSVRVYSGLWTALTGITYFVIHPIACFVPIFILMQQFASYISFKKYYHTLVKSLHLDEDLIHCHIELVHGRKIKARISSNELLDIKELNPLSAELKKELQLSHFSSDYVIIFSTANFEDMFRELRIIINPTVKCLITNHSLLKDIVSGEKLVGYTYIPFGKEDPPQPREETDEELLQRLKNELKL